MRIHSSLREGVGRLTRGAVAVGNFDGVHLGHQALFAEARRAAAALGGATCALTFQPHPARLLAPQYAPPLITTRARKLELLAAAGVEEVVEQPFDRAFAATDAAAFVEQLAATGVGAVVVGHDFTYGRLRGGNVETLRASLQPLGVALHVVPPVTVNGLVCSSSKIREFVLEGRVEAANMLLGRPFDLDGEVVRGDGRGKKLGYPTANIRTANELLPAVGVYAVRARVLGDAGPGPHLPGAANLGLNPTFRPADAQAGGAGRPPLMLEVHLFDLDQDLYGSRLRVEFVHRLREERRFSGPDALKEQIAKDVLSARRLLGA